MAINPANIDTVSVDELPPALFNLTDKIPHSIGGDLFSGTVQDLIDIVRLNSNAFQNEVKWLSVDNQYLIDNFDATGLGTNLCLGWAMMNGNNGTTNIDGRVFVAHGSTYNTLGQFGGSADAVVVSHTHAYNTSTDDSGDDGQYIITSPRDPSGLKRSVETTGVSGVNKNMQPYVVVFAMIKL